MSKLQSWYTTLQDDELYYVASDGSVWLGWTDKSGFVMDEATSLPLRVEELHSALVADELLTWVEDVVEPGIEEWAALKAGAAMKRKWAIVPEEEMGKAVAEELLSWPNFRTELASTVRTILQGYETHSFLYGLVKHAVANNVDRIAYNLGPLWKQWAGVVAVDDVFEHAVDALIEHVETVLA